MGENFDVSVFSDEAKMLCGINERFDKEPYEVKNIRFDFVKIMDELCRSREVSGRSEAGRNYSLAITHLEDACIRAVKAFYSI